MASFNPTTDRVASENKTIGDNETNRRNRNQERDSKKRDKKGADVRITRVIRTGR
jgi:hypothetical protein